MQLLTHKLRPDCSWGETDPLLCLKFSTWAALNHLIDLNIACDCFRACFPAGTNRLAPAYRNAHGSIRSESRWRNLFLLGNAIDGSAPILTCSWAIYGFVRAFSKRLSQGGFQLTSNLKTNRSISQGSEYCLCIGIEAKYFISSRNCSCSHINFVQTAVEEKLILCCVLNAPLERR